MDREGIHQFIKEIAGPNATIVDHDRWVSLHCVLAPWTHERGTDKTPSAGISVNEDGSSIYNCYACATKKRSGPLVWLLRELEKYTGDSYKKLIKQIDGNEFLGGTLPEWGERKKSRRKTVRVLDKEYLELFEDARGHPYLAERGIDDATVEYLGIVLDPEDNHGHERLVFPVYTHKGELAGFTGRATGKKIEPKVRDYYGLQKELLLLGSHLVVANDPYVVIVEGLFDYARVAQAGYPVVAAMHAGLTAYQLQILLDIGKPVVLMYDNDDAGERAKEVAIDALQPYLPVSYCRYPKKDKALVGGKWGIPKDPASIAKDSDLDRMMDKAVIA